jgi:hypothetical protein
VRIIWKERSALEAAAGHGIDFHAGEPRRSPDNLIAVIRGFGLWVDQEDARLEIAIRPPDEVYDRAFLQAAKEDIRVYLEEGRLGPPRWISPIVYAHLNA